MTRKLRGSNVSDGGGGGIRIVLLNKRELNEAVAIGNLLEIDLAMAEMFLKVDI